MSGLFHRVQCLHGPPILKRVSECPSLRLGDALVHVYIIVCLSIHPLTDTDGSNVASTFWILSIMLLSAWIGKYPSDSSGYIPLGFLFQFSSAAQSCPTLCNPMNRSMPGLPVHHQLPDFTQTHVHCIGDAIQPSHPLPSPSPPAPNLSQQQGLFK